MSHSQNPDPARPDPSLDERKFEQDTAAKTRELDLKEREIAAREREVAAKELELSRSRWLNPTALGLLAAALGLIGSVVVARVNNENTQKVERLHAQSNLVLEAIKTKPEAVCDNLNFFVRILLLDDPNKAIESTCGRSSNGIPSLFTSSLADTSTVEITVLDAETKTPLPDTKVTLNPGLSNRITEGTTGSNGIVLIRLAFTALPPTGIKVSAEKDGYITFSRILELSQSYQFRIALTKASR